MKEISTTITDGEIIAIRELDGYIDPDGQYIKYSKQSITESLGHNNYGIPIKRQYIERMYEITFSDPNGNLREVHYFGEPSLVGDRGIFKITRQGVIKFSGIGISQR